MKAIFIFLTTLSFSMGHAKEARIEVHCLTSLTKVERKQLCGEKKTCDWSTLITSDRAAVWNYKKSQVIVREIPNRNILRVTFKGQGISIPMPWCSSLKKLSLSQIKDDDIKLLKSENETVYLLPKEKNAQGSMLEAINHPCRKLKKIAYSTNNKYQLYYLLPAKKKSCLKKN